MSEAPWQAPFAGEPVRATVTVPGSKSETNRALVLAALADGPSHIAHPLLARDTRLMMSALASLGVGLAERHGSVDVTPGTLRGPAAIDCGLAGTVMRFVPPVASLAIGGVRFDGDRRARERPMKPVLDALRHLGVRIGDHTDTLPFTIEATGSVTGGVVTLDASASSQFISALLLAAARYDRGLDVRHDGKPVPSLPHVEMTVAMLRRRGVVVTTDEPDRWVVEPGDIGAVDVEVEPDLSNAAPFLAAGLVTSGSTTVRGWPRETHQAGDHLREILAAFGADVRFGSGGLTVTGRGEISGIDVDLHETGELTPVVAAVAAVADSPSYLRGIGHLRGHETDRLAALATELGLRGADVRETEDGLEIRPGKLSGGVFHTYHDHRMAHAGTVLALVVPDIVIDDVGTTAKTHPHFVAAWLAMLR